MKLKFRFHVDTVNRYPGIGNRIKFHRTIGLVYPGLRSWKNKVYTILDEDIKLHLFKMSRGDIWISKSVIDGRLAKLISKFKKL